MAEVNAGILEIYLAPGGAAFPTDGAGCIGLGFSGKPKLEIKPFNPIKNEKFNFEIPQAMNVKAVIPFEAFSVENLNFIFTALKSGHVAAKIVTSGIAKTTDYTSTGGIFTFDGVNSLGIAIKAKFGPKERTIELTLEKAYEIDTITSIITASKTATLPGTLPIPALDTDTIFTGAMHGLKLGAASALSSERIADWGIELDSRGNVNQMNKMRVSGIDVNIKTVYSGTDPDEMNSLIELNAIEDDVSVHIATAAEGFEIQLKQLGLFGKGEFDLDDDKRELSHIVTGYYPIEFIDLGDDVVLNSQFVPAV